MGETTVLARVEREGDLTIRGVNQRVLVVKLLNSAAEGYENVKQMGQECLSRSKAPCVLRLLRE